MPKPKNTEVNFPRGVHTVHIPFIPDSGSYDQLYKQIHRIKWPKNTRYVSAQIMVSIDARYGETNYEVSQVTIEKKK